MIADEPDSKHAGSQSTLNTKLRRGELFDGISSSHIKMFNLRWRIRDWIMPHYGQHSTRTRSRKHIIDRITYPTASRKRNIAVLHSQRRKGDETWFARWYSDKIQNDNTRVTQEFTAISKRMDLLHPSIGVSFRHAKTPMIRSGPKPLASQNGPTQPDDLSRHPPLTTCSERSHNHPTYADRTHSLLVSYR